MVRITERQLTDADTEWLNEPISYNPHSVRNLIKSLERTPPETDGQADQKPAAKSQLDEEG